MGDFDHEGTGARPAQTSNLALFSLIAGIAAWFLFPFIGAIAAVILGHMGLGEIRRSGGRMGGRGLAIGGLVMGYAQFAAFVLALVLGVLAVLFLSAGRMEAISSRAHEARTNVARGQMAMIESALEIYAHDNFDLYPTSEQGLRALVSEPASPPVPKKWRGPYLADDVPLDPWKNEYRYLQPGKRSPDAFDLWSTGPDGTDGTEDDIYN